MNYGKSSNWECQWKITEPSDGGKVERTEGGGWVVKNTTPVDREYIHPVIERERKMQGKSRSPTFSRQRAINSGRFSVTNSWSM
jgi:hypothetical protein